MQRMAASVMDVPKRFSCSGMYPFQFWPGCVDTHAENASAGAVANAWAKERVGAASVS